MEDGHDAGWVNSKFTSMMSPARYCVTGVGPGDGLNLRAFPSASSRIKTVLNRHQCEIAFLPYAVGNWQAMAGSPRYFRGDPDLSKLGRGHLPQWD
jgi:hypothetical protein